MLQQNWLALSPILLAALLAKVAVADVPLYGQCGGSTYSGDTVCASGSVCQYQNDFYSQCLVGTAAAATTTTKTTTTTKSSTTKASSATKTSTTTKASSTTKAASTTTKSTTAAATTTASSGGGGAGGTVTGMQGYATLNGGTTGGAGGPTTTVTTLAGLRAAVAGTSPKIVRLTSIITGDGGVVDVGSNTSVLGACGGGLTGSGFRVKEGTNVIFRNLLLYKSPAPTDLIGLQYATNVWIDHNEFYSDLDHGKDFYDGQTDFTHASDFITVSYNYYHDHYKVSLVGHSDNNGAEDTGHLRVSYSHNYFLNVGSRLPSLRFGTGHCWNNFAKNVINSGFDSRDGAQMLLENNVFVNATDPLQTTLNGGYDNSYGNDWGGGVIQETTGTFTKAPYSYTLDATSTVASFVPANAGTCKITV